MTIRGALVAASLAASTQAVAAACPGSASAGESVTIAGTDDDNRLRLSDGRLVRLAGLDDASLRLPPLAGQEATLLAGPSPDRHGALRGDLVVEGASLAADLVSEGEARLRPAPGDGACTADLLPLEAIARSAGLGLWADPAYAVADAGDPAAVGRLDGRFALVEGRVLHVGRSGATVWIDFGKDWSEDVTLAVPRKAEAGFAAAGLVLDGLMGQRVRARGVVTMRDGPRIEITEPAALERIDRAAD